MRTPRKYFEVNLSGTQNIVSAMKEFNCQKIVFSSTAAVYGNRKDEMYSEEMDCQPLNPYGESKLKAEILLEETKGLQAIILRYFNVVGGQSEILYDRSSENLFNNILFSISTNRNMKIYGKDLPTRDGTCIRDFINVADIVSAHVEAQKYLYSHQHSKPLILNVGTGVGHTILEIVKLFELYSKKVIQKEMCDARKGDPIKAVAAPFLASTLIDFRAKKNIEQSIMESLSNY
jgi:UDP-glucose 4-epimerase